MTFLAADGVTPSNEGRGYVMRRVIRRAVLQAGRIGLEPPFLAGLAGVVVEQMGEAYPELPRARTEIERVLAEEEQRFGETLARGLTLFEEASADGEISGDEAFRLHDTYGFPLELTEELARERGLPVDEDRFHDLMEEQRLRSRKVSSEVEVRVSGDVRSEFVGYEKTDVLTAILAYEDLGDGRFQAKLEQSPFYPAGGGQVSDTGYIEDEETGARAELVEATRLPEDDQVLTFEGEGFAAGMRVRAVVPWSVRFPTMANHTATHLLHKALQDVLGEHARQAGSAVRPDKLRFDFAHPQALTDEERGRGRAAGERGDLPQPAGAGLHRPDRGARKLGALMLFGEKYGDEVRLVDIAGYRASSAAARTCATAEIGPFVITSRASVGSARGGSRPTSGEAYALRGRPKSSASCEPSSSGPGARVRSATRRWRSRSSRGATRRSAASTSSSARRPAWTRTRCSRSPTGSSRLARRPLLCSARPRTGVSTSSPTSTSRSRGGSTRSP
jgi:alanyl-tRNA synthetase